MYYPGSHVRELEGHRRISGKRVLVLSTIQRPIPTRNIVKLPKNIGFYDFVLLKGKEMGWYLVYFVEWKKQKRKEGQNVTWKTKEGKISNNYILHSNFIQSFPLETKPFSPAKTGTMHGYVGTISAFNGFHAWSAWASFTLSYVAFFTRLYHLQLRTTRSSTYRGLLLLLLFTRIFQMSILRWIIVVGIVLPHCQILT